MTPRNVSTRFHGQRGHFATGINSDLIRLARLVRGSDFRFRLGFGVVMPVARAMFRPFARAGNPPRAPPAGNTPTPDFGTPGYALAATSAPQGPAKAGKDRAPTPRPPSSKVLQIDLPVLGYDRTGLDVHLRRFRCCAWVLRTQMDGAISSFQMVPKVPVRGGTYLIASADKPMPVRAASDCRVGGELLLPRPQPRDLEVVGSTPSLAPPSGHTVLSRGCW